MTGLPVGSEVVFLTLVDQGSLTTVEEAQTEPVIAATTPPTTPLTCLESPAWLTHSGLNLTTGETLHFSGLEYNVTTADDGHLQLCPMANSSLGPQTVISKNLTLLETAQEQAQRSIAPGNQTYSLS